MRALLGLLTACCLLLVAATTVSADKRIVSAMSTALTDKGITDSSAFIIGTGSADKHSPNPQKLAREKAVKAVFYKLNGRIRNVILATKNRPGGGHQNVAAYYSTVAQNPRVVIKLPGIIDVPIPTAVMNDSDNVYFIVAVEREELIDFYTKKSEKLREEIDTILNDPELLRNPTYAGQQYLSTYSRYEALKEAEMIVLGANNHLTTEQVFQTLQRNVTQHHDTIYTVNQYFESKYPVTDVRSVAHVISEQLAMQNPNSSDRVQLDRFTYGISELPSKFSVSLVGALEQQLTVQWATFSPPEPSASNAHPLGFGKNITSRLSGTFWELGNKITVRATLRDVNTGEFQAVTVVRFNKNLNNINVDSYAPPRYDLAVDTLVAEAEEQLAGGFKPRRTEAPPRVGASIVEADRGASRPGQPTPLQPNPGTHGHIGSGFTVDLRTDRREQNPYFYVGDRTNVYVRVNRPAYYRLGYQFVDGRYAILSDNNYINKVNEWVKVPGRLVFTEPTGTESIRVIAQETQLPPIETYTDGRNRFLIEPPSSRTRGGVEKARDYRAMMRGGVMEPEPEEGNQDTSEPDLRGGAMEKEYPAAAQIHIVTDRR